MRTFIVKELNANTVSITGSEAVHAYRVIRIKENDEVRLADGKGKIAIAIVERSKRNEIVCSIKTIEENKDGVAELLNIAVAMPKGNRMDDMVRSLTELGVGEITPLQTERSIRDCKIDRLVRIANEAFKQCRRNKLPKINPITKLSDLSQKNKIIVLDPNGKDSLNCNISKTTILIGPEGGFSHNEEKYLKTINADFLNIADSILRIETAAIVGTGVVINKWKQETE